jgi:DNA polymerase III delta subunit
MAAARTRRSADSDPVTSDTTSARVILLTGTDAAGKATEAKRLIETAADADFADFDVESLDGNTTTADRVLSAISLSPFGTGRRVVHVRDAQQLDLEEQKRIAAGLDKLPASGLLILQAGAPIYEDGKVKRASVVATELSSAVKKWGKIAEFSPPKADDARGWIQNLVRETGKTLTGDALALLTQLPPEDMQRLPAEIAKAAAHAGDSPTISALDIEATLSRSPDDVIFKLCDAAAAALPKRWATFPPCSKAAAAPTPSRPVRSFCSLVRSACSPSSTIWPKSDLQAARCRPRSPPCSPPMARRPSSPTHA